MSAVAAWVSARREPSRELLALMLAVMGRRGTERAHVRTVGNGALAAGRYAWECSEGFAGSETVLQSNGLLVAADATLYYRGDLLRALGDEKPGGGTNSHLIAAAYRKWGTDLARHLEGDFAAVVWDSAAQRLVAFRDFSGCRPLYYAVNADRIALASAARALLQDPGVSDQLNLVALAGDAAGFLGTSGPETTYRDVTLLPAGHTLVWSAQTGPRTSAHWTPPRWQRRRHASFDEAAEALRGLLAGATRERLSPHGVTAVSLSGGWDSPSVFGAANAVLERHALPGTVLPVSVSYPEGDPGREDELISLIAERWNAPVRWIQAYDVPILDAAEAHAADRDIPWDHLYRRWNQRLGREARALDARVLLSGYGGDQLFQVSDVYLADLLRGLRWITLYREWKVKRSAGFRPFFRWAIGPNLGPLALGVARWLRRGRRLHGYVDRELPDWIRHDFVEETGLLSRERRHVPTRRVRSRAEAEAHWFLTEPYFPRVHSAVVSYALEEGVELRSPLFDRRIVEFAATRPWRDRSLGPETKRLLRAAVRGWVPDEVLAPRKFRTGITGGYAVHSVAETVAPIAKALLDGQLHLAELGIVEPVKFGAALERMLASKRSGLEHPVFLTVQTELWLRAREREEAEARAREAEQAKTANGTVRV